MNAFKLVAKKVIHIFTKEPRIHVTYLYYEKKYFLHTDIDTPWFQGEGLETCC